MKKFRRICALVLTVIMAASTLCFGTTANAAAPEWQTVDCDFSDAELTDGQFTKGPFTAVGNVSANASISEDSGNKYLKYTAGNNYRFYPTYFTGTTYTITGRVKFEGNPTSDAYLGFMFRLDNTDDSDSQAYVYYYPNDSKLNFFGSNYTNEFDPSAWYSFRIVRAGSKIGLSMWAEGIGYWEKEGSVSTSSEAKNTPTFRIMTNGASVCFDDLYYTHDHIWEAGFENSSVIASSGGLTGPVAGRGSASNGMNGGVVIAEENGNKYFKHVAALNNYKIGPTYTSQFSSYSAYTFTGDFYFDYDVEQSTDSSKYIGLYLLQNTDGSSFNMLYYPNQGFQIRGQYYDILDLGEWMSFKFVRNGTKLTYTIWNKAEPSRMISGSYDAFTADVGFPTLRFMGGGGVVSPVIGVDNLHYEASTAAISCVGVQASAVSEGKYSVRFIGTIDSANYSKVGFEIKATTAEGTKSFYVEDCLVYTSIIANTDKGIKSYTAKELGGKYLIAIGIHNIPADIGGSGVDDDIAFEITAFCYAAGSETPIKSTTVTCTATNDGSAVTWQ